MYLYQVTRWGNDDSPDGADGEDTHFIVVAKSYVEAAALVDEELEQLPHEHCAGYCNVVAQLGVAQAAADRLSLYLGHVFDIAFMAACSPIFGRATIWILAGSTPPTTRSRPLLGVSASRR